MTKIDNTKLPLEDDYNIDIRCSVPQYRQSISNHPYDWMIYDRNTGILMATGYARSYLHAHNIISNWLKLDEYWKENSSRKIIDISNSPMGRIIRQSLDLTMEEDSGD